LKKYAELLFGRFIVYDVLPARQGFQLRKMRTTDEGFRVLKKAYFVAFVVGIIYGEVSGTSIIAGDARLLKSGCALER